MNLQLLEIIASRPDYTLSGQDKKIVEFFVEYMDHNSLWLLRYDVAEDPKFIFTNDAQHFTFSLSQIKKHYADMKSGIALRWEEIPFEYITGRFDEGE
jgi:hypothetical protein